MIETMYSVTIAALSGEEDRMLHALRAAGIVHIRQMAASCEASQRIAARAKSLMTVMNAVSDEAGKGAKCAQEKLSGTDFESLHESLEKAIAESSAAVSEKLRIQGEISRIESWGDFDPDRVRELASMGCALRFYTVDRKGDIWVLLGKRKYPAIFPAVIRAPSGVLVTARKHQAQPYRKTLAQFDNGSCRTGVKAHRSTRVKIPYPQAVSVLYTAYKLIFNIFYKRLRQAPVTGKRASRHSSSVKQ